MKEFPSSFVIWRADIIFIVDLSPLFGTIQLFEMLYLIKSEKSFRKKLLKLEEN